MTPDAVRGNGILDELFLPVRGCEDHPAIVGRDESLSFGELRQRVLDAMDRLATHGVSAGDRVAVTMPRRSETVVSMLAIMSMDAAYVPVDSQWPKARIQQVLDTADVRFQLVDDGALRRHGGSSSRGSSEGTAYIVFTSGSTGGPKAVAVPRTALQNLLGHTARWYPIDAGARSAAVHAFTFDLSIWELFVPLARGSTVVLLDEAARSDPEALAESSERLGVTTLSLTATEARRLVTALNGGRPAGVERVVLGGEAVQLGLCAALHRLGLDVWNLYGPTETTVWCSFHRFRPTDREVTIGRPLPNMSLYVLDDELVPVAPDTSGEIYIAGEGTACGYLNSPTLTAQTFLPDPFALILGSRMYRSGDLGVRRAAGDLLCVGRVDTQVKVRGFRVELAEIEAAIASVDGVDAVAVTVEDSESLSAFVVCDDLLSEVAIRQHLHRLLPVHLLPRRLDRVAALPVNSNGKLDRAKLAGARTLGFGRRIGADEPESTAATVDRLVARAWSETLGVALPRPSDDFFTFGGDSLRAAELVGRVETVFGGGLRVRDLFEVRTLGGLCDRARTLPLATKDTRLLEMMAAAESNTDRFAATATQSFFLTLQRSVPPGALNVVLAWEVDGVLGAGTVRAAVERVRQEHELLRAVCSRRGRSWTFGPPDEGETLELEVVAVKDHLLPELLRSCARRPVGPTGLLWRTTLLQGTRRSVLVIVGHHALLDRTSAAILRSGFVRAYRAVAIGAVDRPTPPLVGFGDYARWHSQDRSSPWQRRSLAYWRSMLAGCSAVEWPRRSEPEVAGDNEFLDVAVELPTNFDASVREVCTAYATTPFIVALAAIGRVIGDATGAERTLIATQMANRAIAGVQDLVGNFTNPVLLNVPTRSGSFASQLAECRSVVLGALENQNAPMDTVLSEPSLRSVRSMPGSVLLQHFVVDDPIDEFHGLEATFLDTEGLIGAQPVDFQLIVAERAGQWSIRALARASLFGPDDTRAAVAALDAALRLVVKELAGALAWWSHG